MDQSGIIGVYTMVMEQWDVLGWVWESGGYLMGRKCIPSDCKASIYETVNVTVNIVQEGLLKPLAIRNGLNIRADTHQQCTKLCTDNATVEQHTHVYTHTFKSVCTLSQRTVWAPAYTFNNFTLDFLSCFFLVLFLCFSLQVLSLFHKKKSKSSKRTF